MLEVCSKNLVKVGRAVRIVGNRWQSIEEKFINSSAQLKACREQSRIEAVNIEPSKGLSLPGLLTGMVMIFPTLCRLRDNTKAGCMDGQLHTRI